MSQEHTIATKAFIEENIELIEREDFIAIYKNLPQEIKEEFTKIMKDSGVVEIEIDDNQIPTTLSQGHFFTWHSRFKHVIKSIRLDDPASDKFTIEFSNEEKIKSYGGSLSWDELKCEIRKKWKLNETIEKKLNETQNAEDAYAKQLQSILAELISGCNRGQDYKEIRKNLDDLFDNLQFQKLILGEYIHPRKIVLYTKNIQKTDLAKTSVEKAFESVFAHEMFHAYHYQDKSVELIERCDYTSKVVKESLASAFEWQYRVEYKIPCKYNLENLWHRLHVFYYPYSGAKNLLTSYGCSGAHCLNKTKFYKIFTKSLSDMDGALRDLLDVNDFYKIKNAISIQTKYVVKPASGATISHDHSKYSFNGKTYFKGPLLVAIVERYIDEHPGVSVSDLKTKFDMSLVFNKKPIILLPSETPAGLKKKAKEKMLLDGVTNIYINNQVQIDDMEEILRIVESLDYDVIKL